MTTATAGAAATGTVLVFEGQGATAIPGEIEVDLTALSPADAQLAIVRHQLERARARAARARVVAVIGQSLGEISALVVAGALAEGDALDLVRLRAELPAKLLPEHDWTMASMTRLPVDRAEAAAAHRAVWVVGRNGPADCIVVGHRTAFDAFVREVGARPHTYRELPVTAPYHTPAMAPVAGELARAAGGCRWRDPQLPVVTPTGPGRVRTAAEAERTVVAALTASVAWREALVDAAGCWPAAAWRECGPSSSLHRFVWKNGLTLDWGEA